MSIVVSLYGRIYTCDCLEVQPGAVLPAGVDVHDLAGLQVGDASDIVGLCPGQPQRVAAFAGHVLEGQDSQSNEVAAMDAFVAFGEDGPHAKEERPFGGPVAGAAGAQLLAGEYQ